MNILKRLPQSRLRSLMAPFGVVAFIVVAVWIVLALRRPMPQRSVVMDVYPDGSLNADLAKHYGEVLAHDGIELKLEPSAGAVESVARLRDPTSATSIALIPGGITTEQESPGLVSLGTLFYQPLWIFSRSHLLQRQQFTRPRPQASRTCWNHRPASSNPAAVYTVGVSREADSW